MAKNKLITLKDIDKMMKKLKNPPKNMKNFRITKTFRTELTYDVGAPSRAEALKIFGICGEFMVEDYAEDLPTIVKIEEVKDGE